MHSFSAGQSSKSLAVPKEGVPFFCTSDIKTAAERLGGVPFFCTAAERLGTAAERLGTAAERLGTGLIQCINFGFSWLASGFLFSLKRSVLWFYCY